MLNILIVMALLSVSFAVPLDIEDKADVDASVPEPEVPSDEAELNPVEPDVQNPEKDLTERSALRPDGSFLSYLECNDGRYPLDPYFNPHFRLQMQDPLYRRWLKQRKCKLLYYF